MCVCEGVEWACVVVRVTQPINMDKTFAIQTQSCTLFEKTYATD